MMHGHEKSDFAIVATKLPNKAGQLAAEAVERRAGTEGNTGQQRTRRTQIRGSVSQALERVRKVERQKSPCTRRKAPKVGAECLNWARSDLCGGRGVTRVPQSPQVRHAVLGNDSSRSQAPLSRALSQSFHVYRKINIIYGGIPRA